jgi:hypothetical protein
MRYATISVKFPDNTLEVIGEYIEHDTSIEFRALLSYAGEEVVYKTWKRQILGYFDSDEMLPSPDLKLVKIADTFGKMGEYTFKIRFKTLLMNQE